MSTPITGSVTATGASASMSGRSFLIGISGTFVGTIAIQIDHPDGTWITESERTAEGIYQIQGLPTEVNCRVNVTAYTSGTIQYSIRGRA